MDKEQEEQRMDDLVQYRKKVAELQAKLAALRTENEALAATIHQLRDGISTCISYKCKPSKELLRVGYDTASILAERDARTLRMAAEICKTVSNNERRFVGTFVHGADCCEFALRAKADELGKAGATEKQ